MAVLAGGGVDRGEHAHKGRTGPVRTRHGAQGFQEGVGLGDKVSAHGNASLAGQHGLSTTVFHHQASVLSGGSGEGGLENGVQGQPHDGVFHGGDRGTVDGINAGLLHHIENAGAIVPKDTGLPSGGTGDGALQQYGAVLVELVGSHLRELAASGPGEVATEAGDEVTGQGLQQGVQQEDRAAAAAGDFPVVGHADQGGAAAVQGQRRAVILGGGFRGGEGFQVAAGGEVPSMHVADDRAPLPDQQQVAVQSQRLAEGLVPNGLRRVQFEQALTGDRVKHVNRSRPGETGRRRGGRTHDDEWAVHGHGRPELGGDADVARKHGGRLHRGGEGAQVEEQGLRIARCAYQQAVATDGQGLSKVAAAVIEVLVQRHRRQR